MLISVTRSLLVLLVRDLVGAKLSINRCENHESCDNIALDFVAEELKLSERKVLRVRRVTFRLDDLREHQSHSSLDI